MTEKGTILLGRIEGPQVHDSLEIIDIRPLTIGGKSRNRLWYEIIESDIDIGTGVLEMIRHPRFTNLPKATTINIALLSLGPEEELSWNDLVKKEAPKYGLQLLPSVTALHLALSDPNSFPDLGFFTVATEPIPDHNGIASLFALDIKPAENYGKKGHKFVLEREYAGPPHGVAPYYLIFGIQ